MPLLFQVGRPDGEWLAVPVADELATVALMFGPRERIREARAQPARPYKSKATGTTETDMKKRCLFF